MVACESVPVAPDRRNTSHCGSMHLTDPTTQVGVTGFTLTSRALQAHRVAAQAGVPRCSPRCLVHPFSSRGWDPRGTDHVPSSSSRGANRWAPGSTPRPVVVAMPPSVRPSRFKRGRRGASTCVVRSRAALRSRHGPNAAIATTTARHENPSMIGHLRGIPVCELWSPAGGSGSHRPSKGSSGRVPSASDNPGLPTRALRGLV